MSEAVTHGVIQAGNKPSIVFQLANQSFYYGKQKVLDDISLTIHQGEKVALLGPSGAGKSTLLEQLYKQQPRNSAIQPQGGGLVELLSVYQNIFMGGLDRVGTLAALWNLVRPLTMARRDITELTRIMGLEDKLWQSVDRLSGGQRQRVALGRALFRRQPVYLGDEPVSSLDPIQAQTLLDYVLKQHDTAVVSLHNRRLALDNFHRVIVLLEGRVLCDCAANLISSDQLDELYQAEPSAQSSTSKGLPNSENDGWVIRTS